MKVSLYYPQELEKQSDEKLYKLDRNTHGLVRVFKFGELNIYPKKADEILQQKI